MVSFLELIYFGVTATPATVPQRHPRLLQERERRHAS